jgi:hypothetical protein
MATERAYEEVIEFIDFDSTNRVSERQAVLDARESRELP